MEIGQNDFANGQVRSRVRQPPTPGKAYSDEPLIGLPSGSSAMLAELVVYPVQADHRLTAGMLGRYWGVVAFEARHSAASRG
jgi:hypothetical protein